MKNKTVGILACIFALFIGAAAQAETKCNENDLACMAAAEKRVKTDSSSVAFSPKIKSVKFVADPVASAAASSKEHRVNAAHPASITEDDSSTLAKMEAQQQAAQDPDALRKAAQNPIASLISVPLQNNTNFAVGPDGDRVQNVFVAQPVIPVALTSKVNMIMRFVTPIVYQPNTLPPTPAVPSGQFGLGDINPSFFFAPTKVGKVIWGIGPTFIIPTATGKTLGQGKLQIGPTAVVLVQPKKWTFGFLVNNTWSVAGKSNRPATNQGIFQYFINYNLNKGYYLTWQPTITFNWKATGADRWLVPFGGGIGRITKIGNQPVNLSVQGYANPVRQPNASPFTLRFQITFLYPKK